MLEAASWRLASELVRRHPARTRLIRAHPGGGQYDCLWIFSTTGSEGDIRLNRNGTIQVLERFDGQRIDHVVREWDEYLRADPREFLLGLETAAGLSPPKSVPPATPATLTVRVLAAIASTAVKSVHPVEIQSGFLDTSGYGAGPNDSLDVFPAIPEVLLNQRPDDLLDQPGYRFWIVLQNGEPVLAFESREGFAWTRRSDVTIPLIPLYEKTRRDVLVVALMLLQRAGQS